VQIFAERGNFAKPVGGKQVLAAAQIFQVSKHNNPFSPTLPI